MAPNEPERKAIGSTITFRTAEEPSSERTKPVIASPRAANDAAPNASARTSDRRCVGHGVDFKRRPSTNSDAACRANTIMIDVSTAARYAAVGSGVARIRLRIPSSRRAIRISASPANAVLAAP